MADQGGDAGKSPHNPGIDLQASLPFTLSFFSFFLIRCHTVNVRLTRTREREWESSR